MLSEARERGLSGEPETKITWGGLWVTIPVFPQSRGRKFSSTKIAGDREGMMVGTRMGRLPRAISLPAQPLRKLCLPLPCHYWQKEPSGARSSLVIVGIPLLLRSLGARLPCRKPGCFREEMRPAPVSVDLYINSGKRPKLSARVGGPVPMCGGLRMNAGKGLKPPGDQRTSSPRSIASDITAGRASELWRTVPVLRPLLLHRGWVTFPFRGQILPVCRPG